MNLAEAPPRLPIDGTNARFDRSNSSNGSKRQLWTDGRESRRMCLCSIWLAWRVDVWIEQMPRSGSVTTWDERRARLREIYENRDGDLDEIAESDVPPDLDARVPEDMGECVEGGGQVGPPAPGGTVGQAGRAHDANGGH